MKPQPNSTAGRAAVAATFIRSSQMLVSAILLALFYFLFFVSDILSIAIGQGVRHALRKALKPSHWCWLPDWAQPTWVSNIPGNAYAVDDFTIGAVGPFPELNDHNAILAAVPLPAVLKGRPPPARYWSIQAFVKGNDPSADTILCDRELEVGATGEYELALCSAAARADAIAAGRPFPANWIDTGAGFKCMIGVRAFQVAAGRAWRAPEVRELGCEEGPAWPTAGVERIQGPVATDLARRWTSPAVGVLLSSLVIAVFPSLAPTVRAMLWTPDGPLMAPDGDASALGACACAPCPSGRARRSLRSRIACLRPPPAHQEVHEADPRRARSRAQL